jgi:hypothetical protein
VRTLLAAVLVALSALVMLVPSGAHAQTAADQAAAEALFKQARDLMAAGSFAEACPKLAESQRLDPSAGTLLNLATCYEKNGQIASAWVTFKGAASAATRANEPERAKLARAKVLELESKLPTLAIVVPAVADLPDLVVKRDGETVGRASWGTPIPVDPGPHAIEASAPGKKPWQTEAKVDGPGAKASVEVPPLLEERAAAPPGAGTGATAGTGPAPAAPAPVPASPAPSSAGSTQRVLGVLVAGVGVAGIAVGSVFGVLAGSQKNDAASQCSGTVCNATGLADLNDARTKATVSTAGFIAGGALLAGGVVLYLVAPHAASTTGLGVGPGADGSVAGLTLRGGW